MKLRQLSLALLATAIPSTQALKLAVALPSSHSAALASTSIGTSATLHSTPSVRAPLAHWGGFTFDLSQIASSQNASEELYQLDVDSKTYTFAPVLLSVTKDGDLKGAWEIRRGELWGDNGEGMRPVEIKDNMGEGTKTIIARAVGQREFYEERQGFSPLDLLKNPMILLAIVALAFTFGMPYLVENMDPETRAEFEQHQKNGGIATLMGGGGAGGGASAPPNPANFDLAGWMAGQQQKSSKPAEESAKPTGKSSGSDAKSGGRRR